LLAGGAALLVLAGSAGWLALRAIPGLRAVPAEARVGAGPPAADPPPVAAFIQENYARVKTGMTEAEVRAVLGEPSHVLDFRQAIALLAPDDRAAADPHMRFLIWQRGKDQARVGFLDGKAVLLSAVFPGRKQPAPAATITEESFHKLKYGMPEAEVVKILGPPTRRQDVSVAEVRGAALFWFKGKDSIDCRFANDRLTSAVAGIGRKVLQLDGPDGVPLTDLVPTGGKHLTRGRFDALKLGMSPQEVQDVLGPGISVGQQAMPGGRRSDDTWQYLDGRASVLVHFVNGRLADKQGHDLLAP
jgi:outer membrane protein assembly factor BamE (lipoprotein component of BamABCDE complex)